MTNKYCIELLELFKDQTNTTDEIYKLKSFNEADLKKIYKDIQIYLIETKIYTPSEILLMISKASKFNCRYFKSYWFIFKKVYEEYHPQQVKRLEPIFDYFIYKEYNIVLHPKNGEKIKDFDCKNYTMDVHEENTIYKAIMEDNKGLFVSLIEREDFNYDQKFTSDFYPAYSFSILELCCYHGAVNCFKLLITKYNPNLSVKCLNLSFLRGVPDIVNECLKQTKPDSDYMWHAIVSHNMDFVSFLATEFHKYIHLEDCKFYDNLSVLFFATMLNYSLDECLFYAAYFNIPSLCEYLISHGAGLDYLNDSDDRTPIHNAAYYNCPKTIEVLISHGADFNAKDCEGNTALNYAHMYGYPEIAEILNAHNAIENPNPYEKPLNTIRLLKEMGIDVNIVTLD
ncbi:hypothetical protein TVAG_322640 [Trichomonas vaginalis G3]|uniref:DUF3447 domain-containing protein n=1 Tax=Trichomonas vaginalis (strain ATCC PRA-98 / G3) TaxID=412133 RepID=A2EL16_TRIV3|nr:proteasome regulatory particle assembly [Trichomonas vaginalis G3]EAY06644.1 hypothetical protein TVAG_322640 [Trichomonas vaginalis G3]KAI5552897.1 proteasome regulatory particle assembly [Trichomonas vaginalis G3]|eukprot:XP_001318867.1 hypothetical protein [Trichomonas vaginalis G3]